MGVNKPFFMTLVEPENESFLYLKCCFTTNPRTNKVNLFVENVL